MKQYRSRRAGENIRRTYDLLLGQWGVETEERDVETRYGTTHVILAGNPEAEPLVLFHGVGDDSALMWIYNAKALAGRFRLYAVDTIGGPGKSRMGDSYNRDFDDTLWIDDTLDGLGLETACFVGVSHGGYLVQLYTVHRPQRVRRAVCISSAVGTQEQGSPMKTMMKIFLPEALLPTKRNTLRLLRKLSGAHPEVFTDNPLILEHYGWLLKGFNNMAMGFHKVNGLSNEEIARLRERAVFLAGEEDPFQKLGGRASLLENDMRVFFYPGAGHGLNHELAEEINDRLLCVLTEMN